MNKKTRLLLVLLIFTVLSIISFISGAIGTTLIGGGALSSFFGIAKPHPALPAETIFHIGNFPITNTLVASWITMLVLGCLFFFATRKIKIIPNRMQSFFELIIETLLNFVEDIAGKENGRKFFPLVATIFLFIIGNAWISLLPGFVSLTFAEGEETIHLIRGANTDINVPLAIAVVAFIFVEYWGIKGVGTINYFEKFINVRRFFGGIGLIFRGKLKEGFGGLFNGIIDIFVGVLEAMSEFIRIVSFTFRLFGNMTAGEILLLMTTFLMPWILPIPFYGLELLVGFIQALIFSGLVLIFAAIAVMPHKEH